MPANKLVKSIQIARSGSIDQIRVLIFDWSGGLGERIQCFFGSGCRCCETQLSHDMRCIEIRNRSKTERNEVRELCEAHHDDHFQDVLIDETMRAQFIHVRRAHLSWTVVQFHCEVQEGLLAIWKIA